MEETLYRIELIPAALEDYRKLDGSVRKVEIWGIGKREKAEIYKVVADRLKNKMC